MDQSFGPIAGFYDELMSNVPYRMWVGYLMLLLARREAHPKTLLDVCCGTGTVARLLQDEGYEVEGFDLSAEMISEARSLSPAMRVEVQDATEFDMGRQYGAAYSFFDSLNYILTVEGLRAAILNVARHLEPGGLFVFDVNTAYAFEESMFDQQSMSKRAKVKYRWRSNWDPEKLLVKVNMRFWTEEGETVAVHWQRAHTDAEIRAALADAGFGSIEVFHSYTLERPRATSDRVHYVASLDSPPPQ